MTILESNLPKALMNPKLLQVLLTEKTADTPENKDFKRSGRP